MSNGSLFRILVTSFLFGAVIALFIANDFVTITTGFLLTIPAGLLAGYLEYKSQKGEGEE